MKKTYKAKVSYGMLVVLFLVFFVPVLLGILKNGMTNEVYYMFIILIPTYAFILHMFLSTKYSIEDKFLNIKSGFFFNKTIAISSIKKITKTNSIMSSPAPSFDRIEIRYGKFDEIIISPIDKFNFAKQLTEINPKIENCIIKA